MLTKDTAQLQIPLTIEKHLENYSKMEGHNERHEKLWHAWYQNKNWLSQLLQVSLFSFPTYSKHDESHAASVMNNIEMILGQDRIASLSATDCFVLLHTVYIHDLGMCMLKKDRKEIIENEEFVKMLDRLEQDGDPTVKRAIKVLKRTDYLNSEKEEYTDKMKELYNAKLEVYYAIMELLADYRRSEHGEKSAETLYNWTKDASKLGGGFSMSGVPQRIFLSIAKCAEMHTKDVFSDILKLPRKDGGYASDYYHPRFIAVLLMLGDLLDMDNDRFHPMVMEFVEDFSETSMIHYEKHRAIRKLNISPDVIEIKADCENEKALRLVRKECDMLKEILQNAGYMWAAICPEGFKGTLPYLEETQLYLRGNQIPENLVTAQFHITQKKAFSILEGSNLYEGRFVFLREFLQNAIDATKIQYFNDYCGTAAYYYGDKNLKDKSPVEMNANLSFENYPIEIGMRMQKKDASGKTFDVTAEEILKNSFEDMEYGILVSVKDFGTGIDQERIVAISKVGNSKEKEMKLVREMPSWLCPTAEFGVGLQSAFVLNDSFKCYTHTRSEECYEITFSSGASSRHEGYINVEPLSKREGKYRTYGTCFEIYVPLDKKFPHSESVCTWSGRDPFAEDYASSRPARHAAEMISQMVIYLDRMLGELLFPVRLDIQHRKELQLALDTRSENKIKKMDTDSYKHSAEETPNRWILMTNKESKNYFYDETEDFSCVLEYDTARLHVWDKNTQTFCVVSGRSLLDGEREHRRIRNKAFQRRGTTIYYKGIELQHRCMEEEIEIFEYIDVKASLERKYINISRRGFTAQGEEYFETTVYKKLLETVKKALKYINTKGIVKKLEKNVQNKIADLSQTKKEDIEVPIQREKYYQNIQNVASQIVSIAFLSHLAVRSYRNELSHLGLECSPQEDCLWEETVKNVSNCYDQYIRVKNFLNDDFKKMSVLFDIKCSKSNSGTNYNPESIMILDFFRNDRHYAIYQERKNLYTSWSAYVVEINADIYQKFFERLYAENNLLHPTGNLKENASANVKKISEIEEEIEDAFDAIWAKTREIRNNQSRSAAELQFLIAWLERNLPSIALFGEGSGNKRINVLSQYYMPYIYSNKIQKKLVLTRILENAKEKNISRFSTYAWQGKQYLGVKRLPFSCYFVKRGYFNRAYLNKVIFPLDGELLKEIAAKFEHEEETEAAQNIKMLKEYLDMRSYLGYLMQSNTEEDTRSEKEKMLAEEILTAAKEHGNVTSLSLGIHEFYEDILSFMVVKEDQMKLDKQYFRELSKKSEEWYHTRLDFIKLYLDMLKDKEEVNDQIDELCKKDITKRISVGWYRINEYQVNEEDLSIKTLIEKYQKDCLTDPKTANTRRCMQEYIVKNNIYPMQKERVESCFEKFEKEIFDLLLEMEKEKLEKVIEKIIAG